MATILTGSIVAEIAGSVGTEAYSRNAYGPYVKVRKSPTNPNTVPQQNARAVITAAVAAWQALTDPQRNVYIVEARSRSTKNRLGVSTKLTGYHLFIRQYQLADKASLSAPTSIEPPQMTDNYLFNSIVFSGSDVGVNIIEADNDPTIRATIYATDGRSPGQLSFNPSTTRFMRTTAGGGGGVSNVFFTSQYTAAFGAITGKSGERITAGVNSYRVESGELLKTLYLSTIVP